MTSLRISDAEIIHKYLCCPDGSQDHLKWAGKVSFISPVVSVALAAGRRFHQKDPELDQTCQSYADNTGLSAVIAGNTPNPSQGANCGETYSPLTRLSNPEEVEHCNTVISNLFHAQLAGPANEEFLRRVVQVVGELHDNIPSHSSGIGYSAAQVYQGKSLHFAIADNGIGLMESARTVVGDEIDHEGAIQWCFKEGNTSAKPRDFWAQRVPGDMVVSPFPTTVNTFSNENHHAGKGLWILSELVRMSDGQMAVWTGDTLVRYCSGQWQKPQKTSFWTGLLIEVKLNIASAISVFEDKDSDFDELGERLGF